MLAAAACVAPANERAVPQPAAPAQAPRPLPPPAPVGPATFLYSGEITQYQASLP